MNHNRDWDALRREVPIPGGWKFEDVTVADRHWRMLVAADEEAFLQDNPTTEEWPDPFWTRLWPAARWLAEWTVGREWPENGSVLELGCGSGLVGLAAAACGCRVTLSDYVPLAVELAVANLRGNGIMTAEGEVLDWRSPRNTPTSEFILGADVIYDPELHAPLLDTLAARLQPGGKCWLADPGRRDAVKMFLQQVGEQQWKFKLTDERGAPCSIPERGQLVLIELTR